jgi:hypothetical protein
MNKREMKTMKQKQSAVARARRALCAVALLALAAGAATTRAQEAWTPATLVDRAMIEDLLVDYYAQLGSGRHDFGAFFDPEGIIDVNGTVARGQKAIEEVYRKSAEATPPKPHSWSNRDANTPSW